MTLEHEHDAKLWDLLISGDEKAYSDLFRKYYSPLITYGNSLTSHRILVADCVQEVFLDIWVYRRKLTRPASVKAYLLSGVRKRIARRLERERIFKHPQGLEEAGLDHGLAFRLNFTVLDELILDEETRQQVGQINRLLNQLPERQKEALYLRYHQGLDIPQIAEMMEINPQSASNLLHRAIKFLRRSWVGDTALLLLFLNSI